MTARTRVDDQRTSHSGTYVYPKYDYTWKDTVGNGWRKVCDDVVGSFTTDNPLDICHEYFARPCIVGVKQSTLEEFNDLPIGLQPQPLSTVGHFALPSNWSDLATDVAAGTNPGAAHVSLPVFLGELRDFKDLPLDVGNWVDAAKHLRLGDYGRWFAQIPQWVKANGDKALGLVAKGNLAWQFAARPMIGDISKMLAFELAVMARMRMLAQLASGRRLKRRMLLGLWRENSDWESVQLNSLWTKIYGQRRVYWTNNQWATTRWKLISPVAIPTNLESQRNLALRLTFGITGYEALAAAWELLPWSWLIDWFFNIGNLIGTMNNSIPCILESMCYMRTMSSQTEYRVTSIHKDLQVVGPHTEVQIRKERFALSPYLAYMTFPSQPALSAGQLSILSSLAFLKSMPWS